MLEAILGLASVETEKKRNDINDVAKTSNRICESIGLSRSDVGRRVAMGDLRLGRHQRDPGWKSYASSGVALLTEYFVSPAHKSPVAGRALRRLENVPRELA